MSGDVQILQLEVDEWASRNFPDDTPEAVVLGLMEEAGEVARASLKRYQGIRGTTEEWDAELRKECGDVFIKLCHVANVYGFGLADAVEARWGEVSLRDFVADKQGHGMPQHRLADEAAP